MRLELRTGDETTVRVTVSRRNRLSLLQKLAMSGSARTIASAHGYRDGQLVDDLILILEAEEDEEHYGQRGFPPGPMHPRTEQFLAQFRRPRRNGRSNRAPKDEA